jgi:signal transduction histidine kinase
MADFEQRILIHVVLSKDAELICKVLGNDRIRCHVCKDLQEVSLELERGVSAFLTVEEALASRAAASVYDFLDKQPTWSDLPILVLTMPGANSQWISQAYERLGNLTLLERPIRTSTLLSAARSALRARQRQYEIRLSDQRKDEFLAMLAHELRNPLAPIGAAAQLLELVHGDPEKVKQSSSIIGRQVKHMTNLIDDLLDVARVTRGLVSLNKEPLDINVVLTQAVEQAAPLIKERNHHLALHYLSPPDMGVRR